MKEKKMLGGWYADGRDKVYDPDNKSPYFLKTIFTTNLLKEYEKGGEDALIFSTTDINSKNLKLTKSKYQLIKDFFGEFITTKKYYDRQIWRFIKLSDFLISLGLNVFIIHEDYWPSMYEEPKNLISNDKEGILQKMIKDKKTIKHDSNGVIIDWHPSYDGHISIGNDIIKFINENTNLYNT